MNNISVLVPCYNEAKNLINLLPKINEVMINNKLVNTFEILVINENPIYVSDFIEFAVSTNGAESLKITLGQKFLAYPEKLPPRIPVLLLKNSDIICKMNWLQNRMVN